MNLYVLFSMNSCMPNGHALYVCTRKQTHINHTHDVFFIKVKNVDPQENRGAHPQHSVRSMRF
jgi:hypothetical protein